MSFRRVAAVALSVPALLLMSGPNAMAASGHITDPSGDFPDIRRLDYDNAQRKVVMTLKFASVDDAQNRSFYIQWGKPKKYQVFDSPSAAISELRFYRDADTFRSVECAGLRVTEDSGTNAPTASPGRSPIASIVERPAYRIDSSDCTTHLGRPVEPEVATSTPPGSSPAS